MSFYVQWRTELHLKRWITYHIYRDKGVAIRAAYRLAEKAKVKVRVVRNTTAQRKR